MISFEFDKGDMRRVKKLMESVKGFQKRFLFNLAGEAEVGMKKALSGDVLRIRTGHLWRSIGSFTTNDAAIIGSGVHTGKRVKYANIHATGGTIRPIRSKYLAIPLKGAMTKSGSQLRGGAMGPRDFQNTFVRRAKSGTLMIFQKRGKTGVIPLFALKKSVKIPKRDYVSATLRGLTGKMDSIAATTMQQVTK